MGFSDFRGNQEVVTGCARCSSRDHFPHGVVLADLARLGKIHAWRRWLHALNCLEVLIPTGCRISAGDARTVTASGKRRARRTLRGGR